MSHRVLIVESAAASRERIARTLSAMEGVEVVAVPSGYEALRLLPRHRFDLILTDAAIPDIDGLELVNFVKKSPPYRRTPLLVLSERDEAELALRALSAGATAVLPRSIEAEALASIVRDHLEPEQFAASG